MNCERLYRAILAGKDPEAPEGLAFFSFIAWVCRYLERRFASAQETGSVKETTGHIIGTLLGWIVDHTPQGDMLHSSRSLARTRAWDLGRPYAAKMPELTRWVKKVGYLAFGDEYDLTHLRTSVEGLDAKNPFVVHAA